MASVIGSSISAPLSFRGIPLLSPPLLPSRVYSTLSLNNFKSGWGGRRLWLVPVNCVSEQSTKETEGDSESKMTPSSSDNGSGISAYSWCTGLGGLGFLETSYLTYLKLSGSDAFCPIGGGGACGSVLNSDYSSFFGVPLPLIGVLAYGVVAVLGLQLGGKKLPFEIGQTTGIRVKGGFLQICAAGLVVTSLSASYSSYQPVSTSIAETDLPFFETEVTTKSSPLAISLAKHLRSIGAKLYGAFWCSHCLEQKEMFGREAAEILDYVECFPDGYRKGIKIAKACADIKIEGFPTWEINGQVLSGDQDFSELASVSGIKLEDLSQAN